ncbi:MULTISPECIES: hypothetical protein [unclassified Mesorhizobium]|uniref:hypothetical protein n=1 Tax=unclassified Mesorhizobium TaxID=325217 RepID=UPI0003CE95D3|nr:hypothetical protein [Mesorhizobium sp. LSJC255A00]ESX21011.1 hypothetical protein X766_06385 [Mesorhizobium sp. LSJC255A00]
MTRRLVAHFPVFSGLLAAAGDVRTVLAGFDLLKIDGEGLRDRPLSIGAKR